MLYTIISLTYTAQFYHKFNELMAAHYTLRQHINSQLTVWLWTITPAYSYTTRPIEIDWEG